MWKEFLNSVKIKKLKKPNLAVDDYYTTEKILQPTQNLNVENTQYYVPTIQNTTQNNELELSKNLCLTNKQLKSISRGKQKIDATLDLHGYTQSTAYSALGQFIFSSYDKHYRMLLVITGKGKNRPLDEETFKVTLNSMMKTWLNTPGIRQKILYFSHAAKHHGGSGAFYILLRKKHD